MARQFCVVCQLAESFFVRVRAPLLFCVGCIFPSCYVAGLRPLPCALTAERARVLVQHIRLYRRWLRDFVHMCTPARLAIALVVSWQRALLCILMVS